MFLEEFTSTMILHHNLGSEHSTRTLYCTSWHISELMLPTNTLAQIQEYCMFRAAGFLLCMPRVFLSYRNIIAQVTENDNLYFPTIFP